VIVITTASLLLLLTACTSSFPKPLSKKDEEKYLNLYLNGDINARQILIEHNLRLVAHVIKKYSSLGIDNDDLLSIGTIGLIKGISSYDLTRKTKLATYAARCIDNEILMYIRYSKKFANDVFMQTPVSTDKDGNEITVMETIPNEENSVCQIAETNIDLSLLSHAFKKLTSREKLILSLRYGLGNNEELTQREIAKLLNISRSYVSRIEKKALQKLKELIS